MVDDRDRLFTTLTDEDEPCSSGLNSENDTLLRSRFFGRVSLCWFQFLAFRSIKTSVGESSSDAHHSSLNTSADNTNTARFDVAKLVWDGSWHVVKHSDLPLWLQDNDYLINWHRPPVRSFGYCFSSIFRWHTETGNIWTHLIGGLVVLALLGFSLRHILDIYWTNVLLHVSPDRSFRRAFRREARICSFLHFGDALPLFLDLVSHSQWVGSIKDWVKICLRLPLWAYFTYLRQIRLLWNRAPYYGQLCSLGLLHILLWNSIKNCIYG